MASQPKPLESRVGSVDDLVMVEHSLAEAFRQEDWEALSALLHRRSSLLEGLTAQTLTVSERSRLAESAAFGHRLLEEWGRVCRRMVEDSGREREAERAYRPTSEDHAFGTEA